MATLTIRLDSKLERDLARDALRRQLTVRRFRELRRRAIPYAEAAGYFTDEDFFRDIS